MSPESQAAQKVLDEAFARFKVDYPEVARTIETMSVSFEQYLATMQGLRPDLETVSGTAKMPV